MLCSCVFFFKQKTAYEMRISDWSSDVCSSDLHFWDFLASADDEANAVLATGRGLMRSHPRSELMETSRREGGSTSDIGGWAAESYQIAVRLAYGPDRPTATDPTTSIRPSERRSEEHTSELQSPMRISYAV